MLRKIQSIVHFLVDAIARNCIRIGDKDLGNERFHSQGLAEFFHRDLGFVNFIAVQGEHAVLSSREQSFVFSASPR